MEDLAPATRNARIHSSEQIAQLVASISAFGWTNPILIDEDRAIIAGHGRLEAARAAGLSEVPTITLTGLGTAQKRALAIADNKLALNAGWGHRLVCGDSTDAGVVDAALDGVKPHLMVTDPPYGVDYDPDWRNRADRANGKPYGASAIGVVENDKRVDWSEAWALFPGNISYVWHAGRHASAVQASLEAVGFDIRCQIIWAKTRFAISRGDYHWQHEPCWYAVKGTGHWTGNRSQTTLWTIEHQKSETGHSTQKPVECMRRPIENNSSPGRACHAIEISPQYVDVTIRRWQQFTGQTATLERDGRAFADIETERRLVDAA